MHISEMRTVDKYIMHITTKMKKLFIGVLLISWSTVVFAQMPYLDQSLSSEERAEDLISRLTLEEKTALMMNSSDAVERLGIPKYDWWNEALHGVARNGTATVFPQAIGMAASFDNVMVGKVFTMISDEARVKNRQAIEQDLFGKYKGLTMWTPNINIFRDPRWGRGQETYGEDPYLTSVMGLSVIKGLQGDGKDGYSKLYACAKHYAVHSGPEWNRHSFNAENIDSRDLWETYLPAFKVAVQEGDVKQVMCAYNRFEGEPCCGSDQLLVKILREQWGYQGVVVSDCGAIDNFYKKDRHGTHADEAHASADAILSGTDLECGDAYKSIPEAVKLGLITEKQIDVSLKRLLKARFELGEIDGQSPWDQLPDSLVNCVAHQSMTLEAARASLVLLQNSGVLPLSKDAKIGLIGPAANDSSMQWGNYNGLPRRTITLYKALQKQIDEKGAVYEIDKNYIGKFASLFPESASDSNEGLKLSIWNNENFEGTALFSEQVIDEKEIPRKRAWLKGQPMGGESARFEGVFNPSVTGEIEFVINTTLDFDLSVDGQKIETKRVSGNFNVAKIEVSSEKRYQMKLDLVRPDGSNEGFTFNFRRKQGVDVAEMLKTFANVDVVLFAGGISAELEKEDADVYAPGFLGGDRTHIELPQYQREIIAALKQAGKKVVLVTFSGSALGLVPESQNCDAIIQAWYPGETGGQAIADVLFGDYNPAGRLPVTFYQNVDQLPDFEDYDMIGHTYRFFDGQPLFSFGHGLSYTTFKYGSPQLSAKKIKVGSPVRLIVPVTNTGSVDGEEVVQVYLRKKNDVDGPIKSLRAFERVNIPYEESVNVTFELTKQNLEWWEPNSQSMKVHAGEYELLIGGSSDIENLTILPFKIK
jgi:beta-glucosidase